MSNKLPIKVKKNNIIKKFFNYIKKIFKKKTSEQHIDRTEQTISEDRKTKISEQYKLENMDEVNADIIKEANRKSKIEEIIRLIEKKPEILKKLDIPKLEIIDKYYKDEIKKYKRKLS